MNDIENIIWETSEQRTQIANRESSDTIIRSYIRFFTGDSLIHTRFITISVVSNAIDQILFK